jgi:recombination protein RecR
MRLQYLKNRIKNELGGRAEEIIIAVSPTLLSDLLFEVIKDEFKNYTTKISRLGRGIPTGGEIEFADEETLKNALERRS